MERDPQHVHSDEGKPITVMFSVSNERTQHYDDVVEYMLNNAVAKSRADGYSPSKSEIDFFRKELIRYVVIRRDLDTAQKLTFRKGGNILNEANTGLPSRIKLL